jgi:hypothetical protein
VNIFNISYDIEECIENIDFGEGENQYDDVNKLIKYNNSRYIRLTSAYLQRFIYRIYINIIIFFQLSLL